MDLNVLQIKSKIYSYIIWCPWHNLSFLMHNIDIIVFVLIDVIRIKWDNLWQVHSKQSMAFVLFADSW